MAVVATAVVDIQEVVVAAGAAEVVAAAAVAGPVAEAQEIVARNTNAAINICTISRGSPAGVYTMPSSKILMPRFAQLRKSCDASTVLVTIRRRRLSQARDDRSKCAWTVQSWPCARAIVMCSNRAQTTPRRDKPTRNQGRRF